jgi:MFS family permease
MSLALLGDALLYAVLPAYAADFGLTLAWVGVMLSANRFVRVFAYGAIGRMTRAIGVRTTCFGAAVTATVSTALYGVGDGPIVILAARLLWGLTYAALVLATLSYAVEYRAKAGTRVGVGQAIQRIGPILALFAGAWLVGVVGPQAVFLFLVVPTALAVPLAFRLPKDQVSTPKRVQPASLVQPKSIDLVFFLQGYGVDGVFAFSITLIFARETSLETAVISGAALLALRHFAEAIAAPLFGWTADHLGARRVFVTAALLTMAGFVFVSIGLTVLGAVVMLVFRGALASLGPAVISQSLSHEDDVIGPMARMQAWRDFGAACGPLVTGILLPFVSPELQHAGVAVALAFGLTYWWVDRARHWG